jgi:hypothetical protein
MDTVYYQVQLPLFEAYKNQPRKNTLISELFGNIDDVVKLSRSLALAFKESYELFSKETQKPSLKAITQIFRENTEEIKRVYSVYCSNFWNVDNLLKENTEFKNTVEKQLYTSCPDVKANISWQLIKPVQRVMKYPLFLNQLLRTLKMASADGSVQDGLDSLEFELKNCLDSVTESIDYINEAKRRKEMAIKYRRPTKNAKSKLSLQAFKKKSHRIGRKWGQKAGLLDNVQQNTNSKYPEFDKLTVKLRVLQEQIQYVQSDAHNWKGRAHHYVRELHVYVRALVHLSGTTPTDFGQLAPTRSIENNDLDCSGFLKELYRRTEEFFCERLNILVSEVKKDVEIELESLKSMFIGPELLLEKRTDKLCDLNMYGEHDQSSEAQEARLQFQALHDQLTEDVPRLIHLGKQFVTLCTNRLLYIQEQFHSELSQLFSEVTALNTVIPGEQMITIKENNGIIEDFGEDFPSKFGPSKFYPNEFDPNNQNSLIPSHGLIPFNSQFRFPNSSTSPDLIGFEEEYVPEYLSNFKMPEHPVSNMQKTRSLGNIRIEPDSSVHSPKENQSFDSADTGSIDHQKYKFSYSPNQIYYLKEDYSSSHGNLQRGDRVALQDVHKHGWLSVTSLDYDGMDQIVLPEGLLSEVKIEPRFSGVRISEAKTAENRSFEPSVERVERDLNTELKPGKALNSVQRRNLSSAETHNLPDSPNLEKSLSLPKNTSPNLNRNSKKYPSNLNQNPVKIESKK